jgi:hypothetical protein
MANLYRFGITLLFLIGATGLVYGQDAPKRCKSDKVQGAPKYRIGTAYRTVESKPTQVLYISIKPESFDRAEIIALAEQLKRDFCTEARLGVFIFSDHDAAKYFTADGNSPQVYWDALHGDYTLDRDTGEEHVAFWPDLSRPQDKVKITLSSKTSP